MKVTICSSSRDSIDPYYGSVARGVSSYLARNEFDLILGGSFVSMMGVCYDEFKKHNRDIYAYTTSKYSDELEGQEYTDCKICEDTFELKKNLFNDSDVVVILPGGPGTLSEVLSFIEEKRSNDMDKLLIIYDENNYYDKLISILDDFVKEKFADSSIYDYFKVTHNKEEFVIALGGLYDKRRNM